MQALDRMQFAKPTPIQAQTIPVALQDDQDILGTAQTGTGKTGAFAMPLVVKLLTDEQTSVLVLTPTRELALQVIGVFHELLRFERSIGTALLIGGEPIQRQVVQLKARPRLVVGTPGRINDHIMRGNFHPEKISALVLDETDLMLDMGFDVQIETIIQCMPIIRQTLMFSATLPPRIEKLAGKYLKKPIRISIGTESTPHQNIEQETLNVMDREKYGHLLKQLEKREGSIIIFVKTRDRADQISNKLYREGYQAVAIHGNLHQSKRQRVLKGFRNQKHRILVATDVASRGIDVPHIRHVINYDLPQSPEDYVHRIGRTARAGEKGSAVSFLTKRTSHLWKAIKKLLDLNMREEKETQQSRSAARKKSSFWSKIRRRRRKSGHRTKKDRG